MNLIPASHYAWNGQNLAAAGAPESGPARASGELRPIPDDAIAIVPMRNLVLFPGVIVPVTIGRETSTLAAQEGARSERRIGFLLQRDPGLDAPTDDQLHWVGTTGNILRYVTDPEGRHHLVVQGQTRFRVLEFLQGWPFRVARVALIDDAEQGKGPAAPALEARFHQLKQQALEAAQLLPQAPAELASAISAIDSPARLADMVANYIDAKPEQKQELLEMFDLPRRLDRVLELLSERVSVLRLSREIGEQTQKAFDQRQREVVLREQMRQIQKELGEGDDASAEIAEIGKALDEAEMPDEVAKHVRKELKRLERMQEGGGEYSMLRTWLEWMTELPWKAEPAKDIDVSEARRVLDSDHFGLEKVKRRILEYLAVRKLNPEGKSPILCFVGPPGVGKTSLGQSIARATGRKFQRVALGGLHDEAEVRGHRRTYIGALPGNIIQAVRRAESRTSVLMLDEIDKLGMGGFHGDPSSALLEVLDPEQNGKFRDNYLGVDFDLSKTLFIATANQLDTIPGPLRDRMEIIQLPGYTEEEKLEIARRYLVKRQLESNGLMAGALEVVPGGSSAAPVAAQVTLSDEAIRAIVADYTREAGVRSLEREIGAVLRNVAMRVAEGETGPIAVGPDDLHAVLGPKRFESEVALRTNVPGVATGLAWTPVGGDILFIEASRVPGSGRLILTGQLGDVMKESAQAALTLAKTLTGQSLEKSDIHVHVPAGATPKDGPSAGVAMFLALSSLLTGKPVKNDVAMTGEISLRGLVLPIGGVKEKTLAALRAGIRTVMLPRRNRKDLEDIPAEARQKLQFIWLERVEDALEFGMGISAEDLRRDSKPAEEAALA